MQRSQLFLGKIYNTKYHKGLWWLSRCQAEGWQIGDLRPEYCMMEFTLIAGTAPTNLVVEKHVNVNR